MRRYLHVVRRCLIACCIAGATAACHDAPTVPYALQQLAGGEGWVAVGVPEGTPTLSTWLPYVDRSSPGGAAAAERIGRLERDARRAQLAGRLQLARELEREAVRVAVLALGRAPDPPVLQRGLFALDRWADGVRAQVELKSAPELAASVLVVESTRVEAEAALSAGDTTAAVLLLARAAERVRAHAPDAVALRVLARVEARLEAEPRRAPAVERALHLVRSAREELVVGSPTRALRRALYALQLAEGRQLHAVPAPAPEPCPAGGCEGL